MDCRNEYGIWSYLLWNQKTSKEGRLLEQTAAQNTETIEESPLIKGSNMQFETAGGSPGSSENHNPSAFSYQERNEKFLHYRRLSRVSTACCDNSLRVITSPGEANSNREGLGKAWRIGGAMSESISPYPKRQLPVLIAHP